MDTAWLAEGLSYDAPVALGGCRCGRSSFECCEYNVFVFDGARGFEEMRMDGRAVIVCHDSADAPASGTFAHMLQMAIVRDPTWTLGPKISALAEKREAVFRDAAKSALVDSITLNHTAKTMLESNRPEAPLWIKCAAYRLADAVLYHNGAVPMGSHTMAQLRDLRQSPANEALSGVYECLGIERATPPLLGRMLKSAVGFAGLLCVGKITTEAMAAKAQSLESSSLPADCYYYIGRTVCGMLQAQYSMTRTISEAELYALRIAVDPDNNAQHAESHTRLLADSADSFARHVGWAGSEGTRGD